MTFVFKCSSRRRLWFILFFVECCTLHTSFCYERKVEVRRIHAIATDRVDIPCEVTPRAPGDKPNLILFYKDHLKKPIYSFDARQTPYPSGYRWANNTLLNNRAYFVSTTRPPTLVIEPTLPSDEGTYVCRLDYHDSPTTSSKVYLEVLALPEPPEIYWNNHHVAGTIGPLVENSLVKLSCLTKGGKPPPSVIWWLEEKQMLDQVQQVEQSGTVRSFLALKAERAINMKALSCHAQIHLSGESVASPLVASIRLNITLAPLGISIEGKEGPILSGTTLVLHCIAWGSHPPAVVHWWKAGKRIQDLKSTIKEGGNVTSSELRLVMSKEDDGSSFTCRASNPDLPNPPLIEVRRLSITYKPWVDLRLKVSSDSITEMIEDADGGTKLITVKQGSDVVLECSLQSNPPPRYLEWLHNGIIIETGEDVWSLHLSKVGRRHAGSYACTATNEVGRGLSPSYNLVVEHSPECARGWLERTHGAEMNKTVTVLCRVEALPSKGLNFTWIKVGKHKRETSVDPLQIQTDGTTSRLTLVPTSQTDFGTFFCKARNSVGPQQTPCKIILVSASPPEQPYNCSSESAKESGSLLVSCLEGFNGGFPQKFNLVALQEGSVVMNITRDFPEWVLEGLEYDRSTALRIAAFNVRGSSQSAKLEVLLRKPPEKPSEDEMTKEGLENEKISMPIIGIFVGTGGVLVLVLIVIAVLIYSARRHFIPSPKGKLGRAKQHTIVVTSASGAPKSTFSSDPDVVTCIRSDSKSSLYKVVDVIPSNPQTQPLIFPQVNEYTNSSGSEASLNEDEELTDLTELGRSDTHPDSSQTKTSCPPPSDCCEAVYIELNKEPLSLACIANEILARNERTPLYENARITYEKTPGNFYESYEHRPLLLENLRSNSVDAIHYRKRDGALFQPYSQYAEPCKHCICNSLNKNSRSVDEFYTNKHLNLDSEQRIANLIKDLQKSSSKGELTEIPYEEMVIIHRNINNPHNPKKSDKKNKRWNKGCGTCMCSSKNSIESLEKPFRQPQKPSESNEIPTYKKFEGLCPCEIGVKTPTGNSKRGFFTPDKELNSGQQIAGASTGKDLPRETKCETSFNLKNVNKKVNDEEVAIANSCEIIDQSIKDLQNQRLDQGNHGSRVKTHVQITHNSTAKKPPVAQRNFSKYARKPLEIENQKEKRKGRTFEFETSKYKELSDGSENLASKNDEKIPVQIHENNGESEVTPSYMEKYPSDSWTETQPTGNLSSDGSEGVSNNKPKPAAVKSRKKYRAPTISNPSSGINVEPETNQRIPQNVPITKTETVSKMELVPERSPSPGESPPKLDTPNQRIIKVKKRQAPLRPAIKPKIQLRELSSSPLHRKRMLNRLEKVKEENEAPKNESTSLSTPIGVIPSSQNDLEEEVTDRILPKTVFPTLQGIDSSGIGDKTKEKSQSDSPLVSFADKCRIENYLPYEDPFRIETEGLSREIENLEKKQLDKIFEKCSAFSSTESLPIAQATIPDQMPVKNVSPLKSILRNTKEGSKLEHF